MTPRDAHGLPLAPGDRVTLAGVVTLAPDGTPPEVLVRPDTPEGKSGALAVWVAARALVKVTT